MRIVLAFDGNPIATAAITWLRERHHADVVALLVDLGQGRALEAARDRALNAGAVRAHVIDARETFAREVVLPSLRADAGTDDDPGLGRLAPRALGQLMLSRTLVDTARIERAAGIAHTCPTDGLDRARVEAAARAASGGVRVLALADESGVIGSSASRRGPEWGIPVDADVNVWGRTIRPSGDDSDAPLPESAFHLTRAPTRCSGEPACVAIRFEAGTPTAVNGVTMPLLELLQTLSTIAGAHGVGRIRRGATWIEAPAAVVLLIAHHTLQDQAWDADTQAFARTVSARYADLIDAGGWFLPLRASLDAFVTRAQQGVTGTVSLQLRQGEIEVTAVENRP
ncbi:MAG: argininosuccinate synthase domain-containing protein [Vicinamibacterales bacterium]